MRTWSAIRDTVRQFLRDEFVSGKELDFSDDELDLHISDCLVEISQRRPYQVREKVTSDGTKEIDTSSIEGLLDVEKVEYPTGGNPPNYRNITRRGDILLIDIDATPTIGDDIYVYCLKVHELTESKSTLNPELEKILIEGAVAKAALAWINQVRVQIGSAISTIDQASSAVDEMSNRIQQAISDLSAGRQLINRVNIGGNPETNYATYAARELSNANTYLNKATGYFRKLTAELNMTGTISRYQAWANGQYTIYQNDLRRLIRPRAWEFYPRN